LVGYGLLCSLPYTCILLHGAKLVPPRSHRPSLKSSVNYNRQIYYIRRRFGSLVPNQPDTDSNGNLPYKDDCLEYFNRNGGVGSQMKLRRNLYISEWYVDGIPTENTFYTSLTHNGHYVSKKFLIGTTADHPGFWRPAVAVGDAVFHREETTKPR